VPGLTQRTAAGRYAQSVLRCLGREGARNECAIAIAWCGRERCCGGRSRCARPNHGCTMRTFRRQQRANASRCAVALSGIAQVLALFYRGRKHVLWCARRSPQHPGGVRAPRPNAAAGSLGDLVRSRCSLCALSFSKCTPSTACDRVGAGFAQNWCCARRSSTTLRTAHARQGGHHLARMGTNARLCRPAALAEYHSFQRWPIPNPAAWRRVRDNIWRGASDSAGDGGCGTTPNLALLCSRKHTAAHLFRRELGCLQRLMRPVAAQRRVIPVRVLASTVAQSLCECWCRRRWIHARAMLYRRTLCPEMVAHLFRGQMGRLQRMVHVAGAWRCIIMIRCRQMLCHREQRECWRRWRWITA
jgi:hypothetical protein